MKTRTVVRIRNTRHKQTFLSNLHSFWNNSCYADAVLVGKTKSGSPFKSVPVNKSILAAASQKFAQLLTNTEDDVNLIFPETDFVIIESFVSFIYSGEIILNADNYRSIGADLKSFFSEWEVHFPEATSEKNLESNSLCRIKALNNDNILNEKHGSSTSRVEESPVSTANNTSNSKLSEDQSANLKKPFNRTNTRKSKKPEKLVKTVSTTPDCSVFNHTSPIDLQDGTRLPTFDRNNGITNEESNVTEEKETIPKLHHGSSADGREESFSSAKGSFNLKSIEDQPVNSKKQPHRAYTRKSKKPEKLVETVSITPDCSVLNHACSIDLQDGPPLSTFDKRFNVTGEKETIPSQLKELCQEPDQTSMPVDSNLGKILPEVEKERNDQPNAHHAKDILSLNENVSKTPSTKPKRLPCATCGKEISADYMTDHVKLHSNERPFICELCGASFVLSERLRRHMKLTHNQKQPQQPKTYPCKTCGKSFNRAKNLKLHEKLHLGVKPYTCPFCDKSFLWQKSFREHKRIHTSEKPYECSVCHRRFTARSAYSMHLRRHEKGLTCFSSEASNFFDAEASLYRCTTCGATFQRQNPFLTHMAIHRGEEAKLPCLHCSETFPSNKLLKEHKIEKHPDVLFKCDVCPAVFTTSRRLSCHALAHKDGKISRCPVCSRCFPTLHELNAHKQSSHSIDMRLSCKMCGKEFKTSMRLKAHFNRVHLKVQSDVRPYQCADCPKTFRQSGHLANHVRIHTGEKPFLCAVCGKSFRVPNSLYVHMKIHTGEKIQCETCGKTFKSFVKLKQHEDTHRVGEEQLSHIPAFKIKETKST